MKYLPLASSPEEERPIAIYFIPLARYVVCEVTLPDYPYYGQEAFPRLYKMHAFVRKL